MLIFCDEAWKERADGRKVGTIAAVAIPKDRYNALADRIFFLAEKYWGFENARSREIKGKQLLNAYELRREEHGQASMKLSFARELMEELRAQSIKIFAIVVHREHEVDLLCEDPDRIDRPYLFLMERIHEYMLELGERATASVTFDDRGMKLNGQVATAYGNFLTRSKVGRSFHTLLRHPFFAYSHNSRGLQLADLICTIVNRQHTLDRTPRIEGFYNIVRRLQWTAAEENEEGYRLQGLRILGE